MLMKFNNKFKKDQIKKNNKQLNSNCKFKNQNLIMKI